MLDVDPESKTFGEHFGVELTGENHHSLWIPPGYAHGFCVLSEEALFFYKCTEFYDPESEGGVNWSDPEISIDWRCSEPLVSAKDQSLPCLKDLKKPSNKE